MRYKQIAIIALAACLLAAAFAVNAAFADDASVDERWEALVSGYRDKEAGTAEAVELRQSLDASAAHGTLYELWQSLGASDARERLLAAWGILLSAAPDGDVSRWRNVKYFDTPREIPRVLMYIDALYTALIELPKLDGLGGVWLASEVMLNFCRSKEGRLEFITTAPVPAADAIADIAQRTSLIGTWKPRTLGRMPLARRVENLPITDDYARMYDMQFFDNEVLPSSNGNYAWDRRTGRIYHVIDHDSMLFRLRR